jgi:hypothetical protein
VIACKNEEKETTNEFQSTSTPAQRFSNVIHEGLSTSVKAYEDLISKPFIVDLCNKRV